MTQLSSLYLHVPFCVHLCNYCDFFKRKLENRNQQFEDFHQFLSSSKLRHEDFLREHKASWSPLDTVYLGGGTPSLWGTGGAFFFQKLLPAPLAEDCEFTMEIDPGTWTTDMIEAWQAVGLNRISVGTQTLDPEFLKIMDRAHNLDETLELLRYLRDGDWNFSLDFLLGIPYSQEKNRDIRRELDLFLSYRPKHVSLYILNARLKYPLTSALPEDEYIRAEYLFVSDYLKTNGFHHYEVSNFALPGFESRHNQKYWQGESVAALGPTGTGYLAVSDTEAVRYKWKVSHPEVETEILTPTELAMENIYLKLRTSTGFPFDPAMKCLSDSWVQQGYATLSGSKIRLTSLGFLMLDSLMDDLFRWEENERRSKCR